MKVKELMKHAIPVLLQTFGGFGGVGAVERLALLAPVPVE